MNKKLTQHFGQAKGLLIERDIILSSSRLRILAGTSVLWQRFDKLTKRRGEGGRRSLWKLPLGRPGMETSSPTSLTSAVRRFDNEMNVSIRGSRSSTDIWWILIMQGSVDVSSLIKCLDQCEFFVSHSVKPWGMWSLTRHLRQCCHFSVKRNEDYNIN